MNAFPEEDGLRKFREWIESPDPTILGKLNVQEGSSARKRGPKFTEKDVNSTKTSTRGSESNNGASSLDQNSFQADKNMLSTDCIDDIKQIFMDKHVNTLFPHYFLLPYHKILLLLSVFSEFIIL